MKEKILVTGADGFIGSHLVEALIKRGYRVRATSYYNAFNTYGWMDTFKKKNSLLEKIQIDLINSDSADMIVKGCDYVFNLAALVGIPYSYKSPQAYVNNNLITTLNLLNASRKNKIKKFIHTSTSEVYGTAKYIPIDENHPLQPQSPYSASKIAADHMVIAHHNSFNLPTNIIRPFNTFGPRQSLRAVIPTIISQAQGNSSHIYLGSLKPKRDLTFIEDTVDGFIKFLKLNKYGNIINLGTGYSISILDLTNLILNILKIEKKIVTKKNRLRPTNSEVMDLLSNNNLAKKILKWKPKYKGRKGLKMALEKTIKWYCSEENIKLFNSKDYVI